MQIRILLDQRQLIAKQSSRQQPRRVQQLMEWGVEFKMYDPQGNGFPSVHTKTWVCDGAVYIGGSANFTNNSLKTSLEHVLFIKDDDVITQYLEWFENLWSIAVDEEQNLATGYSQR